MSFAPDYPAARVYASPNHGLRARPVSLLILHYTGLPTTQAALDALTSPAAEVSAHYLVDEDGGVLQLVPESRRAWHAGRSFWRGETDVNSASIGVEIAHPGHRDPRPYGEAQIEAVIDLAQDICARCGISAEGVLAHSDVAILRKIDPGEFFPWEKLARRGVGRWVEPAPIRADVGLGLGDEGAAVRKLQGKLARYGYEIEIDGRFGERTANAVAAFQRHFRPESANGRADVSTLETLDALLSSRHPKKRSLPLPSFPRAEKSRRRS
ncbi:N-acetylmuramoyl-L-alanine amidase [Methylocystis bryophila]|uniref:N-acetylmuramoyl-L-alanine amidase n=1 Tax=Methylocystis bryophila TaxID=655015 RepID=A0A1W6MSX3_9HYPH|nr:N-acetylmuramoyl-L-alanine amidase [Methylocystis bryophila]ARN80655.1 N-acetylmuramoyl-L-alanine amidase [Methylocystis bryophila]BDV40722.1 N-acetylmuramoyl-L-alanine amidase [Methylocystis bryophila]